MKSMEYLWIDDFSFQQIIKNYETRMGEGEWVGKSETEGTLTFKINIHTV